MTTRLKTGDRVTVKAGIHTGKTGVIQTKRSIMFVVVFDGGGHSQLPASLLRRVDA